jgi:hypothetical protein
MICCLCGLVQEAVCDLLDLEGKESLEIALCKEAAGKSPRAFWAFRRLGYLQVSIYPWLELLDSLSILLIEVIMSVILVINSGST